MKIKYEELGKVARKVKADLTRQGVIDPGRQKVRAKPRDPEKAEALYQRAIARIRKSPPYLDERGRLVFPEYQ